MEIQPSELASKIAESCETVVLRARRPATKRSYCYASQFHPCARRLVLDMTEGDKQPDWSADSLANFARGEDREITLITFLSKAGQVSQPPFKVIGQQERFELKDRKGRVVIVGKVDLTLDFFTLGLKAKGEIKSWNQNSVAKIKRFEDLFNNPWTSRAAYQTLTYLYASGESLGFLILDRHGLPLILLVELEPHLDRMERFLQLAEEAQNHREAGTMPDFHNDYDECRRCWCYGGLCNPPSISEGAEVLTDPELEADLERRQELFDAADEYETLDALIKGRLRGLQQGICGNFVLQGKWQKQTTYDLPDAIKNEYRKENPKGKFILKITKL